MRLVVSRGGGCGPWYPSSPFAQQHFLESPLLFRLSGMCSFTLSKESSRASACLLACLPACFQGEGVLLYYFVLERRRRNGLTKKERGVSVYTIWIIAQYHRYFIAYPFCNTFNNRYFFLLPFARTYIRMFVSPFFFLLSNFFSLLSFYFFFLFCFLFLFFSCYIFFFFLSPTFQLVALEFDKEKIVLNCIFRID